MNGTNRWNGSRLAALGVAVSMGCLVPSCGGSEEGEGLTVPNGGSGGAGQDASTDGSGATWQDAASDTSIEGSATGGTGGGTAGTGGGTGGTGTFEAGPCVISKCQEHVYACGDCEDNDGDGLIDMADPDCLGPCHNAEDTYYGSIPGQNQAPCILDCYFDQDTGQGNDACYWSHQCDPLSVAPDYPPQGSECAYNPNAIVPQAGPPKSCAQLYETQSNTCLDVCGPLIPNGCDCFGCCEIPGAPTTVWLGSTDANGAASCDLDSVKDPDKCKPCTVVPGCFNDCQHCEICLGKTELPPDCYENQPDGGTGGSGTGGSGTGGSGTAGSGGEPCGGQICPEGSQPCGDWCQPPCPEFYFCLTGCCQKNPS